MLLRCCRCLCSRRHLRAFVLLLLSKSSQSCVSRFLILEVLLRPCGYSTDQRGSSGLKQALLCSRSQKAFLGNNDELSGWQQPFSALQALGTLSESACTSASERGPAHSPSFPRPFPRGDRRGVNEEPGELY